MLWLFAASLLATTASAKLPEPDAIYFGGLKHAGDSPLVAVFTGEIAVVARLNGVEIARAPVSIGTSSYVLKTPLDDGQEPRLAGTARPGERIRVFLVNVSTGTEAEAAESASTGGFSIPTARGELNPTDLSTSASLSSGASIMADYATWKMSYLSKGLSATQDDSTADLDRDGRSNFAEFVAGTDPADAASTLGIREVRVRSGVASVRFGPVRMSRRYTLESATNPGGPWTPVSVQRYTEAAADVFVDLIQPPQPTVFFRVRVEVE